MRLFINHKSIQIKWSKPYDVEIQARQFKILFILYIDLSFTSENNIRVLLSFNWFNFFPPSQWHTKPELKITSSPLQNFCTMSIFRQQDFSVCQYLQAKTNRKLGTIREKGITTKLWFLATSNSIRRMCLQFFFCGHWGSCKYKFKE